MRFFWQKQTFTFWPLPEWPGLPDFLWAKIPKTGGEYTKLPQNHQMA
jgi:hypothetical protein